MSCRLIHRRVFSGAPGRALGSKPINLVASRFCGGSGKYQEPA